MTKQSKNVYENNQHYCESSERKNCGRCRNRFFSCFLCWGARMIDIHQHIPHFHFDYLVLFDDFFSLSVLTVIFNTVPVEQNNTASFRVSLKSAVQNSHRHSRGHVIKTHHAEKTCSRWMTIMLHDYVKER